MRPAALRVGLFTLAGAVLIALALAAAGGGWFGARERAVMRFQTSVYGLQIGAPVVLRGVQVGRVTSIGLAPGEGSALHMPVTVEFESDLLRPLLKAAPGAGTAREAPAADAPATALQSLIARGLVARLATQSLLTGLLYVDLDMPATPATTSGAVSLSVASANGLPLIPTAPTRLQTLQSQLEGLDLGQIGRDLAAVASGTRELLTAPQARQALARTAEAAQALQQLAVTLRGEAVPVARSARETLAEARRALAQLEPLLREATPTVRAAGQAAMRVESAASQVGDAAVQARALALAAQPLVAELRRSADELGRAAATLREAADPQSPLRRQTESTLQEVAQAAAALRALATLLEQHPNAIVWGRPRQP